MSYQEQGPPPALAPWVECAWERLDAGEAPARVVPDGCIDLVWTEGAGTQVVGANTTAFLVRLDAGTRVAGVRMRAGGAPALLGVDAESLRDARVPVDQVLGDSGRRLADALERGQEPLATLMAELLGAARTAEQPDALVRVAVGRLHDPATSVAALARDLHVSERQLRRRVTCAVGYGPKRLARVLRLGRALAAARAGAGLARVAAESGYADQAHLAHECRDLAGVPPSWVLAG